MAAYVGWLEGADALLKLGARIDASNNAGDRPIHWATFMRHDDLVAFLERSGAVQERGAVIVPEHVNKVKDFYEKGARSIIAIRGCLRPGRLASKLQHLSEILLPALARSTEPPQAERRVACLAQGRRRSVRGGGQADDPRDVDAVRARRSLEFDLSEFDFDHRILLNDSRSDIVDPVRGPDEACH